MRFISRMKKIYFWRIIMIFTEADYMKGTNNLLQEVLKLKKYKAMSPFFAVLTAIFMSPWILVALLLAATSYVLGFLFKTITSPIDYLHSLVSKEGEGVKHATQFIIYAISWPLIFFLYATVSVTLFTLTVVYALLSCVCYIASLGGFRFHLFLSDATDLAIQVNGKYKIWMPLVFILASVVILLLIPFGQTFWYYFVELSKSQREFFFDLDFEIIWEQMTATFKYYHVAKTKFFVWFSALYSLLLMARFPKTIDKKD